MNPCLCTEVNLSDFDIVSSVESVRRVLRKGGIHEKVLRFCACV